MELIPKDGKYLHWKCGKYDPQKRRQIYLSKRKRCMNCDKIISPDAKRCWICQNRIVAQKRKGKKLPKKWVDSIRQGKKRYHDKIGRITGLIKLIKNTENYREWRKAVFERDDFTCQKCGVRGNRLAPHHLKAISDILKINKIKTVEEAINCKELWDVNNGITLCHDCHKKTPSYGWNKYNKTISK
jgi:5-methylcytosine-specific restriction endonuclease McrA